MKYKEGAKKLIEESENSAKDIERNAKSVEILYKNR